jgi:hydroxylamine reductase
VFCYQCEQTRRSDDLLGCTLARGICGKDATTAALQDLLVYQAKGIGQYASLARGLGAGDDEAAAFLAFALFTTLTNVNFDEQRFTELIAEAAVIRDRVRTAYEQAARQAGTALFTPTGPAAFVPATGLDALVAQAGSLGVLDGLDTVGPDIVGLRALNLYGLKGVCAYAHHAHVMGHRSQTVLAAIEDSLAFLATDPVDGEILLERALGLGHTNLAVMRLLDTANTATFGTPTPTAVRTAPVEGKAILISGHDLPGLLALLEQTRDTGISVYTHGEMLPAHGYPALKAYPHLAGNYGGAWQDQQIDFSRFPGPIVMTSNCMIKPRPAYQDRIFTNGPVGWPGLRHLADHDFTEVIQSALDLPGFDATGPQKTVTVGFGHAAVLGVADTVIDAVRSGDIRHFFLIGGCDGAASGRNYYTEFAQQAPADTVVMTLGCAKYRFNNHDFGDVAGLPRLLDLGQCNDAYSAIQIATALAGAFECSVNDLPLSLVLSWFEQKAVAVLLTLLALGIRNISLGPTLPAFLTPAAVNILVERFGLRTIGDPATDLAQALSA